MPVEPVIKQTLSRSFPAITPPKTVKTKYRQDAKTRRNIRLHASFAHFHPGSQSNRFIAGVEDPVHDIPVLVSFARCLALPHALDEVLHFGLVSVSKGFFGQRSGPSKIEVGLFHHVTCGLFGERYNRRLPRHISEDRTFGSMELIAQVQASKSRPRKFAMRNPAAGEAQDEKRVVLAPGFVVVNQVISPRHDFDNRVLFPEKVTGRLDTMAPEVVHGAAAGFSDVPEVCAVGTTVGFSGTHPNNSTDAAALDYFTCLHDRRRKHFGFGIAVESA